MTGVTLATYIHDPDGALYKAIAENISLLMKMYDGIVVIVTKMTDEAIIDELEKNGCDVEFQSNGVGQEFIGDARRMAISEALKKGTGLIHFADIDRILYWVQFYPEELRGVIQDIPKHYFLIIGRTNGAMETHPRSQVETEGLADEVCSLILGLDVDVTAASRGMSSEAARLILKYSKAKYCNTDSEWPIIVHCKSDGLMGYVEVDGLGFEDWLKDTKGVKSAGGLEGWKRLRDESPRSWLHRIRTAHGIAETALTTYNELR